jgi:hypothetical protein
LIEALPQQGQYVVAYAVVMPRIAKASGQLVGQIMALIECSQRQQASITGDLAAGKIGADGLMTSEGQDQLWQNSLYQAMDAPKGNAGSAKALFIIPFKASFLFWLDLS